MGKMKKGASGIDIRVIAVSLISGLLALLACYIIAHRVSSFRTDFYPSFERNTAAFSAPSRTFPNGAVDPNTATAEELMTIPGIGEKTAEAIIAEREANGPFLYPEDLMAVKGIGEKKLEKFLPYLDFSAP